MPEGNIGVSCDFFRLCSISPAKKGLQSLMSAVSYQRRWRMTAGVLLIVILLPILAVVSSSLVPSEDWDHFVGYVLPDAVVNSVLLVLAVVLGTSVLGVSLAWLTTMVDLPGRKIFGWLLLAPMAVPRYVMGFVYMGLLDYSGPIQSKVRAGGWGLSFEFRSFWGLVFVMTMSLYPYVFMMARVAFQSMGKGAMEAAHTLGWGSWAIFFRLAIPLIVPWWIGGGVLVTMECLSDFGTVSIFSYDTFTTAIYKAWFGFFSPHLAAQMALVFFVFLLVLFWIKYWASKRRQFFSLSGLGRAYRPMIGLSLNGKILSVCYCSVVLIAGILVPLGQLIYWVFQETKGAGAEVPWRVLMNTLSLSTAVSLVAVVVAMLLVLAGRFDRSWLGRVCGFFASLGYCLPGAVLAVGVFLSAVWLERVVGMMFPSFSEAVPELAAGSLWVVAFGLVVRFLAVAYTTIDNGLKRVAPNIDEVGILHGYRGLRGAMRIHLPLVWKSIFAGGVLVFIDTLKEMPLVLMTRPHGWDTLAVKIFGYTSEGLWQQAALPALILLLFGFLPVAMLALGAERH